MAQQNRKGGFTIVELLVVVSIIALLIALLLPAVQKGRDKALISQSVANLKNLASANETYAGDWGDRQFTCVPDDAGTVNGNCGTYLSTIACPPQQLLGWDVNGAMWGYFIGNTGRCSRYGYPGNCGNWVTHLPMEIGGSAFGAFRIPGLKAFHDYVNGRFYDPTLYAPKDVVPYNNISKYFTNAAEFTYNNADGLYEDSSYCFSPAAMYDVKVFQRNQAALNGNGYTNPTTLPAGYRSPPVSRCKYPSLKTRMIEHSWLQNTPDSPINPNFAGNTTPWFFNHGYNSAPACLFFDGHIELVGCQRSMAADQRVSAAGQNNGSCWSKNTPLGANGYYGGQSYDFLVKTSFHILTTDGIEGRDVLGAEG
ncbi:MAG: type II secretion system protein [Phycisphaerales bacterium]|jgi:prepilin-type N-terminal cleavage/methylation domain-containing protein